MERVLEPEVMDTAWEATAYDRMDHTDVNRAFVERFLAVGGSGHVLDLGCGPAHIPIELCRCDPDVRVTAVDAATHMLAAARARLGEAGMQDRIHLVHADAKGLPFADREFDAVMSNSIVHHLPDPRPFFREVARLVRPGGAVIVRDLFRPSSEAELDHLVDLYASEATAEQQKLFADSLHAAFTAAEIRGMLDECGLADLCVCESSDRHWTAEREGVILRLEGHVEQPLELTFSALRRLPHSALEEAERPRAAVRGVALETLLASARPLAGSTHLTLHAADGFAASVPIGEVASRAGLLFCEGSRPLPRERGGPVRFVVPDVASCRTGGVDRCAQVKRLTRIVISTVPGTNPPDFSPPAAG